MKLKELTLHNYEGLTQNFQLKNKEINNILIQEISGDQIGFVFYADADYEIFDCDIYNNRNVSFFDGYEVISTVEEYEQFLQVQEENENI